MLTIDTRKEDRYTPLIPALEAILLSPKGTKLEIIMTDPKACSDLKSYLIENKLGFREIYHDEIITLQFTT